MEEEEEKRRERNNGIKVELEKEIDKIKEK